MGKAPSDFNDLAATKGTTAVKQQIAAVVDAEKGIPFNPFLIKPNGVYLVVPEKVRDLLRLC